MKRRTILLCSALFLPLLAYCGSRAALCLGIAPKGTEAPYFPPPRSEPGLHAVSVTETKLVFPDEPLPSKSVRMAANNNIAAVPHSDGRTYLAVRTAPDHFAGPGALIQVMSSADEEHWDMEHHVIIGTDVREPQLLSMHGKLFLYFSRLGKNPYAFEPQGIFVRIRDESGAWSGSRSLDLPGYIGWRVRMENGVAYLSAYRGGEHIYAFDGEPLSVEVFTSTDGVGWSPAQSTRPAIYVGGGSEMDFAVANDGKLHAVIRNEAGDANGWGSLVCTSSEAASAWVCKADRKKYDSPFLFSHDGEIYAMARRNVSEDGTFDLGHGSGAVRSVINQLSYITKAKRCSLWRFADDGARLAFVLDLPSRGDTCYPSVIPGTRPDEVVVYDYSSPIDGPDLPWSVGQRNPTFVYRHTVRFTRLPEK